jgi:hypothetical protein
MCGSRFFFLFLILAVLNNANAGEVTSEFSDGDTLTASSLNDIKSNVNDNHTRLSTVEAAVQNIPSNNKDYTGYKTPFSEIGSPKNVVIMVDDSDSDYTSYNVRTFYINSSEQFSVNGTLNTPTLVSQNVDVAVDKSDSSLIYIGVNTDMPTSEAFIDYTTESATFDTSSLAKTVVDDTYSTQISCSGVGITKYCNIDDQENNITLHTSRYLSVQRLLGSGSIKGIDFDDLKASDKYYTSFRSRYFEIYAKGIGKVFKINKSGGSVYEVIYYRVDGVEGGSLVGTPFDVGSVLTGFFF